MIAAASMNASKPLLPSAHSTIQTTRPGGDGEDQSHAAGILAGRSLIGQRQPRRQFAHDRPDGAGRVLPLAGGAHQAGPHDHPVGARVGRLLAPARAC